METHFLDFHFLLSGNTLMAIMMRVCIRHLISMLMNRHQENRSKRPILVSVRNTVKRRALKSTFCFWSQKHNLILSTDCRLLPAAILWNVNFGYLSFVSLAHSNSCRLPISGLLVILNESWRNKHWHDTLLSESSSQYSSSYLIMGSWTGHSQVSWIRVSSSASASKLDGWAGTWNQTDTDMLATTDAQLFLRYWHEIKHAK